MTEFSVMATDTNATLEEKLAAMAAAGEITLPKNPGKFARHKKIRLPEGMSAAQIISDMREERAQTILPRLKRFD